MLHADMLTKLKTDLMFRESKPECVTPPHDQSLCSAVAVTHMRMVSQQEDS